MTELMLLKIHFFNIFNQYTRMNTENVILLVNLDMYHEKFIACVSLHRAQRKFQIMLHIKYIYECSAFFIQKIYLDFIILQRCKNLSVF